jgi:type I restriction enzyme, S subunit
MRESRIDWLGMIPEHWEVRRLRDSIEGCFNGVWGDEPDGHDDIVCVRVADFLRSRLRVKIDEPTLRAVRPTDRRRRLLRPSDLLVEKSGGGDLQPVGVVMLFDHDIPAVCSNFVARMPVAKGYDSGFLTYLHSHLYAIGLNRRSIKQSIGIQNLDSSAYLSEHVAYPPLEEQRAIVRFLDRADRRIRRAIRAKQKLIALVNEQKQAVIHQAVTRGLDPNVRLKPSGVDWLGDAPEHWKIMQLRRLVRRGRRITYGIVQPGEPDSSGRYMVRGQDYSVGWASPETVFRVSDAIEAPYRRSRLESGDLVLTIVGAGVGNVAKVPAWLEGANITQTTARISVDGSIAEPDFVAAALESPVGKSNVDRYVKGAAQPGLNLEHVRLFVIPLPPLQEQHDIVRAISRDTDGMTKTIGDARIAIELLREYRTRLIADAVTGRADVREAAAQLPDEADAPEPLDGVDVEEISAPEVDDLEPIDV